MIIPLVSWGWTSSKNWAKFGIRKPSDDNKHTALKEMKQPGLNVKINAGNAFVAQNQQFNLNKNENIENNEPKWFRITGWKLSEGKNLRFPEKIQNAEQGKPDKVWTGTAGNNVELGITKTCYGAQGFGLSVLSAKAGPACCLSIP